MTGEELKNRTKALALRVIRVARSLPKDGVAKILGNQIVRSATSVAANYQSACKARSKADCISKLGIVEEEIDETQFWLELIVDSGLMKRERINDLLNKTQQLIAIFAASRITARKSR